MKNKPGIVILVLETRAKEKQNFKKSVDKRKL